MKHYHQICNICRRLTDFNSDFDYLDQIGSLILALQIFTISYCVDNIFREFGFGQNSTKDSR